MVLMAHTIKEVTLDVKLKHVHRQRGLSWRWPMAPLVSLMPLSHPHLWRAAQVRHHRTHLSSHWLLYGKQRITTCLVQCNVLVQNIKYRSRYARSLLCEQQAPPALQLHHNNAACCPLPMIRTKSLLIMIFKTPRRKDSFLHVPSTLMSSGV